MLQSYAVCAGLLWFFYTLTQFSAVDAKAHPPEDAQLMEKDIEKQNKAEADGDWDVSFTNSGARGQTLQTLALAINAPRTSVFAAIPPRHRKHQCGRTERTTFCFVP